MKLEQSFANFLEKTVDLNPTRIEVAKSGINTMTNFLKANELFKDLFIDTKPQGSFRQGTIIKPSQENQDFDVDLLFELKVVEEWTPADYLENLSGEFKAVDRYKDKIDTRGKNRCVTIDYESDFHIDIVPAIKTGTGYMIMNKKNDRFEPTDGDGYAIWFEGKNTITGKDHLSSIVRLVKYIRDSKNVFEAKSILLTTLLGNQVDSFDNAYNQYSDLPTAFLTIIDRLDQYLLQNPSMPSINNPVLPEENFNRHWDQKKYERFRTKIHEIGIQAKDAYEDEDPEESLEKWRKIFGDEFPLEDEDVDSSAVVTESFSLGDVSHRKPITDICIGENLICKVSIDAYLYHPSGQIRYRGINSDAKFKNNLAIKYIAKTNAKEPYDVYWQVVNTGNHARQFKGLRGDFFKAHFLSGTLCSNPFINWERSEYTGKHWIECFIVKDNYCVARSGRFMVNIKNPNF
jgi:hypothetical protein